MAEHNLRLGRLAEDAHVGDPTVRDEVPRAGRVPTPLGALRLALLRLLDLAADRRDHQVATKPNARVGEGAQRLHVAGERALHVRDPEPVEPPLLDERARLEARDVREPGLTPRVGRVHVAVEHQARPAARALADAEHVRAAFLHLLPLNGQPQVPERVGHEVRHRFFRAREARHPDRPRGPVDEPRLVDRGGDALVELGHPRLRPARAA